MSERVEMAVCEVCGKEVDCLTSRRHFRDVTVCEDPDEAVQCCREHTDEEAREGHHGR
jgi:hypothetical protein